MKNPAELDLTWESLFLYIILVFSMCVFLPSGTVPNLIYVFAKHLAHGLMIYVNMFRSNRHFGPLTDLRHDSASRGLWSSAL